MNYPEIKTRRLVLTTLAITDIGDLMSVYGDPAVMKYSDTEPCTDLKEIGKIIAYHLEDSGCRYGLFLH